jgi:hypothetical protein
MSLTSFMKSPEGSKLFNTLPKVQGHLVYCKGDLADQSKGLVVPRFQGADPAIVGTAYDFCCRAITQRVNGLLIEEELSPVLHAGLRLIEARGMLKKRELGDLQLAVAMIWKTRIDYINGASIPVVELARGALKLAQVEQAYRSGKLIADPMTNENVQDLSSLINSTIKGSRLLTTNQKIYMNPSFGYHSLLVGGADADMVFGTTLIDIKTTVHMKSFQEYFQQLFGYYLLSELDETFDASLQNLAIYLPRFDALFFIRLDVIRSLIDIDTFAKEFHKLIEEYQI